jgi:sodium transport system permease protein
LPLFLAAALPAVIAGWTDMPCDRLTATAPLLGSCLAAREALRGSLDSTAGAIAWCSAAVWAGLALRALACALSVERVLGSGGPAAQEEGPRRRARAALAWGGAGVLALYLVGGSLQARLGLAGLLLTQWGLLPLLAWLCVRGAARGNRGIAEELGCSWPAAPHALGALLCAPGLAWLVRGLAELQERVAPLPSSLIEAAERAAFLADAGPLALFGALALTPAVCEELFFRGALLSGLRRGFGAGSCLFWQALLFGAAHASIHRFLPSALVGALLAALTLRTRSLLPAVLLHAGYDAAQLLAFKTVWAGEPTLALFTIPGLYLLVRAPGRPLAARLLPARAAGS